MASFQLIQAEYDFQLTLLRDIIFQNKIKRVCSIFSDLLANISYFIWKWPAIRVEFNEDNVKFANEFIIK